MKFARIVRFAEARLRVAEHEGTIRALQSCGVSVSVHPSATIVHPNGLSIGNNVFIGEACFIHAEGGVQIRDNAQLSDRVTIYGSDLDLDTPAGSLHCGPRRSWRQTVIGRNVRIGSLAFICPGVRIGDGAIIGLGAVVKKDVAPGEIIQPVMQCDTAKCHKDRLASQESRCCNVCNNRLLKRNITAAPWPTGRTHHPRIVFVASSGRSGSTSIAQWLDGSDGVRGRHESRLQLVQWSTEYAEGTASREQTLKRLEDLFLDGTVYDPDIVHVESDQKFHNLLPLLAEILPQAKFIWLIRSGYAVVSSIVGRGWYSDQPSDFQNHHVDWWWENWRVQGSRTIPPADGWLDMNQFEKCAWYWGHTNRTIEVAVEDLPADKVMRLRLEDMKAEADRVASFCGVSNLGKKVPFANRASHSMYSSSVWSRDERHAFERWCGPLMARFYPGTMN